MVRLTQVLHPIGCPSLRDLIGVSIVRTYCSGCTSGRRTPRGAQNEARRLPALAAELVSRQVAADPVALGLVGSLNRPGGNATGVTNSGVEVASKQLELLHELVPTATTVAPLVNPTNPTLADALLRDAQPAAGKLG